MSILALLRPEPEGWRARAACRNINPNVFFPIKAPGVDLRAAVRDAKKHCSTCPVRMPCLEYALANPSEGVYGGTTGGERRTIRRLMRDRNQPVNDRLIIEALAAVAARRARRP